MLDEVTPQLIVDVVDEMLIVQRGKELGYTLGDEQFKSVVDNIKKDNKLETDEQFQAALKQENMTLADLRQEPRAADDRVSACSRTRCMSKVGVTDDEARAYYDAHLTEFTTPPSVTLREILVDVPTDAQGRQRRRRTRRRRRRPRTIRARALAGESFEKLAADLSDCAVARQRRPDRSARASTISRPSCGRSSRPMKVGDVTAAAAHARAAIRS